MTKKRNTSEFIAQARQVHGARYDYSEADYRGSKVKLTITCPEHGPFHQTPNVHLTGHGCPHCAITKSTGGRKLDPAHVLERLRGTLLGSQYTYPRFNEEYRRTTDKITAVCSDHGPFLVSPDKIFKGRGCPACGRERTRQAREVSEREFLDRAKDVHGHKYDYSGLNWRGYAHPVTIRCPIHGAFEQRPQSHILQRSGCPECSRINKPQHQPVPFDVFVSRARRVHGGRYQYQREGYASVNGVVQIVCDRHGPFDQRGSDHLEGVNCPACATGGPSRPQIALAQFLEDLGEKVEIDYRYGVGKKEIDVFLPEHRLGVEFNGLYFHSSIFRPRGYHLTKMREAAEVGIDLIQVFEDEWAMRDLQVRMLLINRIGKHLDRVYARQTNVINLSHSEANEFYDIYHIQGGGVLGIHLGLRDRTGEVCAVMTLSRRMSRRQRGGGGEVELSRFATCKKVIGGGSKLFSALLEETGAQQVISYSDNRLFNGRLYEHLGFTKAKVLPPDYCYVGPGFKERLRKQRFQHKHLPKLLGDAYDPNKSERENCEAAGYYRIYDCGLTKWVWTRTCQG